MARRRKNETPEQFFVRQLEGRVQANLYTWRSLDEYQQRNPGGLQLTPQAREQLEQISKALCAAVNELQR